MNEFIRVCPYCGGEFKTNRSEKMYCSQKCRRAFNDKKARAKCKVNPKPTVKCQRCGAFFTKLNGNQRYCSAKCKQEAHKDQITINNAKRQRGNPKAMAEMEELGGWQGLANAIVVQAAKDYTKALMAAHVNPHNEYAAGEIRSCERFFNGEWYTFLTELDPKALQFSLRKAVANEIEANT